MQQKKGIPSAIKIFARLRVFATARSFYDVYDGSRMSKDSLRYYFRIFCRCIKELYGDAFFNRLPTKQELSAISEKYAQHSFKGFIGCVDCCKI